MFSASPVNATEDRVGEVYYLLVLHNRDCEHEKDITSDIYIA